MPCVRLRLLGDPVDLDLEVDVLATEDLHQVVEVSAGVLRAILDQAPAEARLQAARERDHALGVAREQLVVDVRLATLEAVEETLRAELDQVAKALIGGRQQGQVVALDPALGVAVADQVRLEPEDRLDPVLATGLVVLDGAVHDAVVGEPEGRHPELGRAGRHRVDLAGTVEQRVLAVHMQVDDAPAHAPIIATDPVGIDAPNR